MTNSARRLALLALALAGCGPDGATAPTPDPEAPRLVFREDTIELGARFDDEAPEAVVALRNVGGRALKIERIDSNCGCIALGPPPKSIAPGATTELAFQIRLTGMTGRASRHIIVRSDDPASPVSRVAIEADVRPRIEVSSALVELRPKSLEAEGFVDVEVRGGSGEDLAGLSCTPITSNVTATAAIAGKTATVRIVAAPFVDDFQSAMILRLGKAERVVSVKGISARDVRAVPELVWADGPDGARVGEAKLVGREGATWRVKSLKSDRKEMTAEFADGVLRIRIGKGLPPGEFRGNVTVSFEGAKPESLRVGVMAWVESQ